MSSNEPKNLSCPKHNQPWGTIYPDGSADYDCGCTADPTGPGRYVESTIKWSEVKDGDEVIVGGRRIVFRVYPFRADPHPAAPVIRHWQHDETGRVCDCVDCPGPRYHEVNEAFAEAHEKAMREKGNPRA